MQGVIHTELLKKSTCPNCWSDFAVADVRWVSAHEELVGDPRLGADAQSRFLPSRFDLKGNAVDVRGLSCKDLACPECHLKIPRSLLVFKPIFVSIAGTPSCGKSFFLTSMMWQLRRTLPSQFGLLVSDSDPELNQILNHYEEQLFFNSDQSNLVKLAKTDVTGDWYSVVQYGDQSITYPKPFYFDLIPKDNHIHVERSRKISRLLCLYDNAGESFQPGADTVVNQATRHLGAASSWLFCYDLSQDPRFRRLLADKTEDHQVIDSPVTARQEIVLQEMVNRIRRHSELGHKEKSDKPLIIVCTKFDAWKSMLPSDFSLPSPWFQSSQMSTSLLNIPGIKVVSETIRKIFEEHCPEVVATCQHLTNNIYFVPVSATGSPPVKSPETGEYMMRTDQIDPIWCEVPMLLTLSMAGKALIMSGIPRSEKHANKKKKSQISDSELLPPTD